ncbi:MAG: TetR/AcrR family transcriptional regulator [Prevotellaceae bacterium]|jgi:AcrR family transcriptional regulator|nr:TetR/AcrR family transcriptional regulator [Prevotellaceae bacterium]
MITSRKKIIEEAARLFIIHGYKGCRTVEVAELAGLSNNSGLFRYFKTKKEMYRTVVERYVIKMQTPNEKFGDCSHLSLKGFIEHYVVSIGKSMVHMHALIKNGNSTANKYFSFLLESSNNYSDCSNTFFACSDEEIKLWHKVIERAKKTGEIRPDINTYKVAKLFRYAFVGLSYSFAMENGVTTDQIQEELYDIYDMIKK